MSIGDKVKNRGTTENTQRKQSRLLLPWERKLNEGTGRPSSWSGRAGGLRGWEWGEAGWGPRQSQLSAEAWAHPENDSVLSTHVKIIASFTSEVFRITVFLLKSYTH